MLENHHQNQHYHVSRKVIKDGFKGHLFAVLGLDFTSDGKWMVSSGFDGTARLWNYRTKTQEGVFFFQPEALEEVSISPDGRFIATITSESSKAYIYDQKTGQTFQVCPNSVLKGVSAWNSESNLLALADFDDNLIIVDPFSKKEVHRIRIGETSGRSLSWYPSQYLAVGLRNGTIKILDVSKKEIVVELDKDTFNGHLGQINGLCFLTPKILASCADDERIIAWNVNTGAIIEEFKGKLGAISVHGRENIIVVGYETSIQVFNLNNNGNAIEINHGTTGSVVRVDPTKMVICRGLRENEIVFWSIETGEEVFAFKGRKRTIEVAALDSEKMRLITGSIDRLVNVHDLNKKDTLLHQLAGHSEAISAVTIIPSSNLAASGAYDDTLRFWNYLDGSSQGLITGLPLVSSLTFIPNTNFVVVACSGDFSIRVHDFDKLVVLIPDVHEDYINTVVALTNGTILSGSDDGNIKATIINPINTSIVLEYGKPITSLSLSPDETFLAVGSDDGTTFIIHLESQSILKQVNVNGKVKDLAFTPDGKILLIAHQTTLSAWDLEKDRVYHLISTTEPISAIFPMDSTGKGWTVLLCSHDEAITLVEFSEEPPLEPSSSLEPTISETPSELETTIQDEWEQKTISSILLHLENNLNKVKDLLALAQEDFSAQIFESGITLRNEDVKKIASLFLPVADELDTIMSMVLQYAGITVSTEEEAATITLDNHVRNVKEEIKKTKKKISDIIQWGARWQDVAFNEE